MNPYDLDMPYEDDQLPRWLEARIVSPRLRRLVGALAVMTGAKAEPSGALDEFLGDRRSVLERGLAALTPKGVRQLLARPGLLCELERLVLDEGGPHWARVAAESPELRALLERSRRRLSAGRSIGAERDPTTAVG